MSAECKIQIDGCEIRYRDTGGDGPVALMLHGIGGSLELWQGQTETEMPGIRVIALDLPGHGLSGFGNQPYSPETFARFVWRFLDILEIREVYLVGNSMGGNIAILMAGLRPERLRGLVLAAAAALGRDSPLPFRLMTIPLLGRLLTRPSEMAVEQQLKVIFHPGFHITPEIRSCVTRNIMRPGAQTAFRRTLQAMTSLGGQKTAAVRRSLEVLADLTVPVLFVHGREDRVIPFAHSAAAHARVRTSRLVLLDACGHTSQLEQAAVFNGLLQQFIH